MIMFLFFVIISTVCITVLAIVLLPSIYLRVRMMRKQERLVEKINDDYSATVLSLAIKMANSPKVTMVWEESLYWKDILFNFFKNSKAQQEFKMFNYPRAFLFLGISTYLKKHENQKQSNAFRNIFDRYIKENGEPAFLLTRIDQVPFGLVALHLYQINHDTKYLHFADCVFNFLEHSTDPTENIIDYRPGLNVVLNDMLGLTIPFLLEFSRIKMNTRAKEIAEHQMTYYIKYGVDELTGIPSHGINKLSKTKVGSANWGRGIGWYLIGLTHCGKYNKKYVENFDKIKTSILQLKTKHQVWTQFPGSSAAFDASTTLMFWYTMILNDKTVINKTEVFALLKNHLTIDGEILQTSGDTLGLNEYSKAFGKSELSQGLLLLILAELS